MESTLLRLGLVRPRDNREQKEKYLHNLVDHDKALPFQSLLPLAQQGDLPPDEGKLLCRSCGIRGSCNHFARRQRRLNGSAHRTRSAENRWWRTPMSGAFTLGIDQAQEGGGRREEG